MSALLTHLVHGDAHGFGVAVVVQGRGVTAALNGGGKHDVIQLGTRDARPQRSGSKV